MNHYEDEKDILLADAPHRDFPNEARSYVEKALRTLSDPDSALALSVAALYPILRRGKRIAAKHPVIAATLIGAMAIGFLLNKSAEGSAEYRDKHLH
jgi:hypothetical protein